MFRILYDFEVIFESGGRHTVVNEASEGTEVGFIVDFAAVHFRDEDAEHLPGDFGGGDIGAALGDGVDPGVNDEAAAFVLNDC
jgi:hypothetical protein